MIKRVCTYIDISALHHNFNQLKKWAPTSFVVAMVKANAYGHGLLRIAQALPQSNAFGVATLEEALQLRQGGILQPILIMSGFSNLAELKVIATWQLTPIIHDTAQINLLKTTTLSSPLSIWLKMDSGMHRLGLSASDFKAAYQQLSQVPYIQSPIGLMTHLACSDQEGNSHTLGQIAYFQQTITTLTGPRSLACSAAIIAWPQTHAEWIRPGIMLYGVSPFTENTGIQLGLKPVMTLTARLIAIKTIAAGEAIGYGATWVCQTNTQLGIVSIGYGDGYPRQVAAGTPVLVNGQRCSLLGRVSMDMIGIDLTWQPNATVGDEVILWGQGLPIEEIAQKANTNGYELLCKITARVPIAVKS